MSCKDFKHWLRRTWNSWLATTTILILIITGSALLVITPVYYFDIKPSREARKAEAAAKIYRQEWVTRCLKSHNRISCSKLADVKFLFGVNEEEFEACARTQDLDECYLKYKLIYDAGTMQYRLAP